MSEEYLIPVDMEVEEIDHSFDMDVDVEIVSGGGTDVSDTTAVEADVLEGKKFHKADGSLATGTLKFFSNNLIENGDFSVSGATTDGWSAMSASHSTIAVSGGALVLTHTVTSSRNYGIDYDVSTQAGHTYLVRYKYKKTLSATSSNAQTVYALLRGVKDNYLSRVSEIAQNDIIENVGMITTDSANTQLRFSFGGSITQAAANDSMLELYYVELYDITDIID